MYSNTFILNNYIEISLSVLLLKRLYKYILTNFDLFNIFYNFMYEFYNEIYE